MIRSVLPARFALRRLSSAAAELATLSESELVESIRGGKLRSEAWLPLAEQAVASRSVERARLLFDHGTEAESDSAPAWAAWASMESRLGELPLARDLYRQGLLSSPTDATLWRGAAMVERLMGGRSAELRMYAAASDAGVTEDALLLPWAAAEAAEGNVDTARALLERADGSSAHVMHARALLELRKGDKSAAEAALAELDAAVASGEAADSASALALARAEAARLAGDAEAALATLTAATDAVPDCSRVWHARGTAEAALGDVDAARASFTAALSASPKALPVWLSLSALERNAGDLAAARDVLLRAVDELSPRLVSKKSNYRAMCLSTDIKLAWALGNVEEARGNLHGSRVLYDKCLALMPRSHPLRRKAERSAARVHMLKHKYKRMHQSGRPLK